MTFDEEMQAFAAMSEEEQLKAFMEAALEYQASVTPERFDWFVELLKDDADGKIPSQVAAQIEKQ